MAIKQNHRPRQTEGIPQTEHETAKSRDTVVGKACNRKGKRHRNNIKFHCGKLVTGHFTGHCDISSLKVRTEAVLDENSSPVICLTLCKVRRHQWLTKGGQRKEKMAWSNIQGTVFNSFVVTAE